jgi:hypothetical protein
MKELPRIILFLLLAPFFMTMAFILYMWYDWWSGLADFS